MSWQPFGATHGSDLESRRYDLFKLAAPVFRQYGYRGATIKALAHACHLSPAALYHYFPSKAALATSFLDYPRMEWDSIHVPPDMDRLVMLRELIDMSIEELPDFLLAIQLAREVGRSLGEAELGGVFGQGEALFGRVLFEVASGLGRDAAHELAGRILAILVAPYVTGLGSEPGSVRQRMIDLVRLHLVPVGVDPDRFDRIMAEG